MAKININELYLAALDEINEEQRGQLGVDLFNRFANKAIRWVVDRLTGRDYGMEEEVSAIMKTSKVQDLLFPLVRKEIVPVANGSFPFPADYDYFLDLRITGNGKPAQDCSNPDVDIDQVLAGGYGFVQVDVLSHDKISNRINSKIPAIAKKPCAEVMANGFFGYPYRKEGSAFLLYLKEPTTATLAQTLDTTHNTMEYDATTSVDPELHKKLQPLLARKIWQFFAQWTRETGALQLSDAVTKLP